MFERQNRFRRFFKNLILNCWAIWISFFFTFYPSLTQTKPRAETSRLLYIKMSLFLLTRYCAKSGMYQINYLIGFASGYSLKDMLHVEWSCESIKKTTYVGETAANSKANYLRKHSSETRLSHFSGVGLLTCHVNTK